MLKAYPQTRRREPRVPRSPCSISNKIGVGPFCTFWQRVGPSSDISSLKKQATELRSGNNPSRCKYVYFIFRTLYPGFHVQEQEHDFSRCCASSTVELLPRNVFEIFSVGYLSERHTLPMRCAFQLRPT